MNTESNESEPCKTSLWPWANRKDKAQTWSSPRAGQSLSVGGRAVGELSNRAERTTVGRDSRELGAWVLGGEWGSAHKFGQRVQGLFPSQPPFLRASPSLSIETSQQSQISKEQDERCTEIQQVGREELDCRPRPNPGPSASTTPACQRAEGTWTKGTLDLQAPGKAVEGILQGQGAAGGEGLGSWLVSHSRESAAENLKAASQARNVQSTPQPQQCQGRGRPSGKNHGLRLRVTSRGRPIPSRNPENADGGAVPGKMVQPEVPSLLVL